jgi:O-antigen/teichoic acid export membrane protein
MTEISGLERDSDMTTRVASSRLGLETLVVKLGTYAYALPGSIVLARTLGPTGRGAYQVAVTASLIVLTLVLVGLPQSLFRSWGSRPSTELLAVSRLAAVALGCAGMLLCLLVASVGGSTFSGDAGDAVLMIGLTMPVQVHAGCLVVILQSAARTRWVNVAFAVAGVVQTTAILSLWVLDRLTVRSTATAYVVGLAVQWAILWWASRPVGRPEPRTPFRAALVLVRSGLALQAFIVVQFLLLRLDVLFVARISGLDEVGIYAVGVTLAELVWLVTDSLALVLIERATERDQQRAIAVFVPAVRMTILLGVVAATITGALAPFGVPILFGRAFIDAAPVVGLLLPGTVALGVWRAAGPAIVRFGSLWTQPAYAGVALAVNTALNLMLIRPLGAAGAAIASSLAYSVVGFLSVRWLLLRTGSRLSDLVPGPGDLRAIARALPGRA